MPRLPPLPKTTPLSGGLRLLAGSLLLVAAVSAGMLQRSPIIIGSLTLAFSAAFVLGRLAGWQHLARTAGPWRIATSLLSVLLVQAVLVGLLYLLGVGGAAVLGHERQAPPFDAIDLWLPLVLGVVSALLGLAVFRLEHASRPAGADARTSGFDALVHTQDTTATDAELRVLPTPLTPETFYDGIHYAHASRSAQGAYDGTPNAASAGSPARIHAAEVRLGVLLPEGLRALYRVQNGGHLPSLCIAIDGTHAATRYDDLLMPFGGYDDLNPTEQLTTADESFLAFADPDEEEIYGHLFRNGTDRMVVLAQWYRQSLYLDYSQPGEPTVGFVDFDREDWADHVQRWPDFATFFAALRRYEDL